MTVILIVLSVAALAGAAIIAGIVWDAIIRSVEVDVS